MAESTRPGSMRELFAASIVQARRLAEHPRRSMAVDAGLLGFVLLVVCFDLRGKLAFVIAVGVIALHLKVQIKGGVTGVHSRADSGDEEERG